MQGKQGSDAIQGTQKTLEMQGTQGAQELGGMHSARDRREGQEGVQEQGRRYNDTGGRIQLQTLTVCRDATKGEKEKKRKWRKDRRHVAVGTELRTMSRLEYFPHNGEDDLLPIEEEQE